MKIFGTDGIRGQAGIDYITPEFMIKIPSAIVNLGDLKTKRVIIGKDTRLSCYSIENALTAGFTAHGMEVILTGPIPTPAISMLTQSLRADYGIMISASHNPYYDNGIKIFDRNGIKLSKGKEQQIENFINEGSKHSYAINEQFGRARRLDDVIGRYVEYIKSSIPSNEEFLDTKVLLDTANGSAYKIAPEIFWELGCTVQTFNNTPNGLNINENCGATHPEFLANKVRELGCDIGIVLDGDADRLIVIDENGDILDGDNIIAGIVYNMQKETTSMNGVVATVMSNLGFERYMNSLGVNVVRTDVGDKNITQKLIETGYKIGGEQSGHIIIPQYSHTGDGILSAIQLLSAMKKQGWKASNIGKLYKKVPQVLHNVINTTAPTKLMETLSAHYSNESTRVLIRRSGTEHSKVRIMVEGDGDIHTLAKKLEIELGVILLI
ncbi:MAG: phosphoglucosamine mutase [Proteobacteria bacterium]|jgi:phosphoglucosamine mutase|nr:phosphoglucosamine mutase [Pseudomonadota bacterium]